MSQAKLREALSAGASSREKGSPVPDGVLTATSESAEGSEWRSRRSIIDAIASKSSYLDEPGDNTECRSSLYGRFTWRLDKFSEVTKRELRSSTFQVGQYKWYILVYPQGCDVTNHLSLFLCVANYDKLLPGWSHFAQFTIAVINKDPKKSKYSDTLHRFCKKEHDWGWKKFIDLGKLADGFTFADSLVIKAQVQVIPDCPPRPVCTLDTRYRRELVRVYLSNVEGIVRRFVEEKKPLLNRLVGPQALKGFSAFWEELEEEKRISLLSVSAPTVFKSLVKRFFNEKEVTSTLMMDGLYSGAKELELGFHGRHPGESRSGSGSGQGTEGEQSMTMVIDASSNRFLFVDIKGALTLLEKLSLMESVVPVVPVVHCNDPVHPARADNDGGGGGGGGSGADEEGSITDVHDHSISDQDRSSAPQAGDKTSTRDCLDHDECRLANLGRVTLEVFAACYIAETQLEPAWVEAEIIKRQEALIREEEEAERGEAERAAAKAEAEKERRARKKERQRAKKEAERAKKEAEEAERLRQEEQKRAETERRRAELEEKAAERRLKENSAKENGKRAGIINTSPKISANLAEINGNGDKDGDKNGSGKASDGESLKRSTAEKTVQPVHQTESIGLGRLPAQNPTASGAATISSSQIECEEDVKVSLMEKLSSLKSECEEKDKIIAQLRARIDELEGRNAVLGRGAAPPGRDLPENGRMSLDVVMTQAGQSKAGDTVNRQSLPRQSSAPGLAQQATRIPLVHQPQFPSSSMMTSSHAASTGAGLSTGHAGHAVYAPPPQQIYHAGGASTVPVFSATSTATGSRSSSSSSSALLVGVVGTDAVPGTGVQIPLAQPTAPPVGSRTFSSPLPDTNRSKLCQSNGIATDSSGLDDFAHMGLITDLLE